MKRAGELTYFVIFMLTLILAGCTAQAQGISSQRNGSVPLHSGTWPVISRNAPVFASSEYNPATYANDNDYNTSWRSLGTPAWLAFDLSGIPASERSKVLFVWYNESFNYDHTVINNPTYNMPEDYTIEVNAGPGGNKPPQTSWITAVTVTDNHYHSRQHIISMQGYNWIRINSTKADGTYENYDISINVDIYDANYATSDDWIFYGDSITAFSMGHNTINGVGSFSQIINKQIAANFPVEEAGGIGFLTSGDGVKYLNTWLPLFPGKYIGLSYGTNDALGCGDPALFYQNYAFMVQTILHAGKIPVIPHIPWGRMPNLQHCVPLLNAQIDMLYKTFPRIVKGPDLWTFFQRNQDLISDDNIHPTDAGKAAYRQQWANAMLTEVYGIK